MGRYARENTLCALLACVGAAVIGWLGLLSFVWADYETEAAPAMSALVQGHLAQFLRLAPIYGGSLLERAPFALLPSLWGGGELAVYRMLALPCLLGTVALGVWLVAQMRARGDSRLSRAVVLGLCVCNPISLLALEMTHPEEILGGVLCVAAVLLAYRERPVWAGIALGAAIANKEWALLAIGPVLLALPSRRLACALCAGAVAALLVAPFALVRSGSFLTGVGDAAAPSSEIFQPWQAWWFLGHHGALVHGLFGLPKPGYRIAPGWVGRVSHPLILAIAVPLGLALWRPRRPRAGTSAGRSRRPGDALLLLALLLLLRCLLDTWDTIYYMVPFLFALLCWEAIFRARPPLLTLTSVLLAWAAFKWLPAHVDPDLQSAFFLAWTIPLTLLLAARLYGIPVRAPRWAGRRPAPEPAAAARAA